MNLLDRYILREWLKILALAMGATLGLILMQTLYEDLHELIEHGATFADMIMYVVIKMPSFLALVIPIVLLVSLLYAFGLLHRNNEILAMRAAGLGLMRITRSIWIAGLILCALTWWLNASVVPWSVEASRALSDQLEFEYQSTHADKSVLGLTRTIAFDNQRQGRIWMINRYNRYTQRAYGVSVSELDLKRQEKTRIVAREAKFDLDRNCWVFWNGRETWIDPETRDITRTVPFEEKVLPHYTEDPKLMLIFDIKPANLSFFELQRIIDHFRIEENPKVTMYAVRYYTLLADTLSPLIIIVIGVPFAVTGVRVNPAVGVSKAIGLFVLYFIVLKFSGVLGTRGIMEPVMAAWIPNIVMGLLGAWVFYRRR